MRKKFDLVQPLLTERSLNRDGTTMSFNAATFHDRDYMLQGVFAAVRDVTERRMAQAQLFESEARTRAIRAAAVDAIIIIDAGRD